MSAIIHTSKTGSLRSTETTRLLDRRFGGMAASIFASLTRGRPLPASPVRIGIIQPTAIGDMLIGSGVLAAIHRRYPFARMFLFHGPSNRNAVPLLATPVEPICCRFTKVADTLRKMRAAKLDLVIDQTPWANLTALYARLSAPVTVGFAPAGAARGRLFDNPIPHLSTRHEWENHAAAAALFSDASRYRMVVATAPFARAAELPLHRLVLFHMSAGGSRAAEKAWPHAYWALLARRLANAGCVVGFTGLATDHPAAESVAARAGIELISLCGRLPLDELGDLLTQVRLLVTVDTAMVHLASAVDAPVLALHGPTRSWRWGPWARQGRSLDSPHPGAGYITYGFEQSPFAGEVMDALDIDVVSDAAFAMLQAGAAGEAPHRPASSEDAGDMGTDHRGLPRGVPGLRDARPFGQ